MQTLIGDGHIDREDLDAFIKSNDGYVIINQCCNGYVMNEYLVGTSFNLNMIDNYTQYNNETIKTNVTWHSDNEEVAKIDNMGNLNVVGVGKATITATANGVSDYNFATFTLFGDIDTPNIGYEDVTISKDDFTRKVELIVGINADTAAISADLMINNIGTQIPTVIIKNAGWEITRTNYSNGKLSIIAELTDEKLSNTGSSLDDLLPVTSTTIEITVPEQLNVVPVNFTEIVLDTTTLRKTDKNNNVTNPLASLDVARSGNLGITLKDVGPIKEKTSNILVTKDVVGAGRFIYAKLNGTDNGTKSFSTVKDLIDSLNLRDGFAIEIKKTDEITGDISSVAQDEKIRSEIDLYASKGDKLFHYSIINLGDICNDTNYEIDINDVNYLRRAIVGEFKGESGYPDNFVLEATDVNSSNVSENGTRNLGDIGDVIAIRQRIINMKWNDVAD